MGCDAGDVQARGQLWPLTPKRVPRPSPADLHYLFAPLKAARLDYMVQKAVEMGVSRLQPVLTRHSQVARVNTQRMRANAVEAAEQCGILSLPDIGEPMTFGQLLAERDPGRMLVFCDEGAEVTDPVAALAGLPRAPLAVLVGPEGGFAEDERASLLRQSNVVRLSLGPRILRADTAAVAALTLVQALLGDWGSSGRLVDHAGTIDADEADIVAVSPVHAGHVRKASPARAPIGRHLAVDASLQMRRVGDDAAGIIPGKPPTRAKKNRAGERGTARARQQQGKRHDKDEFPTHCLLPAHSDRASLEARSRNEKPDRARDRGAASCTAMGHSQH